MKKNMLVSGLISFVVGLSLLFSMSASAENEIVYKTELDVKKLTCGSCLYSINGELKKLDGFLKMGASLYNGKVYVAHYGTLDVDIIANSITNIGYPASVVSTEEFSFDIAAPAKGAYGGGCGGSSQASGCAATQTTQAPASSCCSFSNDNQSDVIK